MLLWFAAISLALAGPGKPSKLPEGLPPGIVAKIELIPEAPPTAKEIASWNAAQYNNYLVNRDYAAVRVLFDIVNVYLQSPADPNRELIMQTMDVVLNDARARAQSTPGYKGDTALRDALATSHGVMQTYTRRFIREFQPLLTVVPATNQTLAEAERLTPQLREMRASSLANLVVAQQAFAERNGFQDAFAAGEKMPEMKYATATFTSDGVPPTGSALSGDLWVSMANRYLEAAAEIHNVVSDEMVALSKAATTEGPATQLAQKRGLEAFKSLPAKIEALGFFASDTVIHDALVREVSVAQDVYGAELVAMGEIMATGKPSTPEDVDALNTAITRLNGDLTNAINGYLEAQAKFTENWHFAEYNAFVLKRAAAPEALP